MKKIVLACALLTGLASSAFAGSGMSTPDVAPYSLAGDIFETTSARMTGMGGAGLGMSGYSDAFLFNPAVLGESRFRLSIPTVSVTVFNPRAINDTDFFDNLKDAEWVGAVDNLMSTLSYGANEVERIDFGINAQFGHVGIGLNTRQRILASLATSSYLDGEYLVEDTTALTLGFGFRFPLFGSHFSLDLGANAQFLYQMYTSSIDKDTVDVFIDNADDAKFSLAAGWAVPFTFGANLNMPGGFRVSSVARNVNGKFRYHFFEDSKDYDFLSSMKDEDGDYDAGIRYDAGLTWTSPFEGINWIMKPTISVDVQDLANIEEKDDLYSRLYAGAQVTLFKFLDVRYGIAQGYQSVGIGLDAFIFHIDASYWRREYGQRLGDKSIDALTLRFQLITR